MSRFLFGFLGLVSLSLDASAQISGRVAVLDKGGVERRVVKDVLVYVDGVEEAIPTEL